ncbi:MAG: phenylacetate--CoA ligase family protein [Armatimonadetes bacterium]|nr:phenylacetate--CoA ligase family protein [Armatimonadota bacterium]
MALGERVRSLGFWALDRLRGGPVARHLADLQLLQHDLPEVKRRQAQRLKALLAHACETTPYYRQFAGAAELSDFPVLQKRTIRERHADFFSSSYDRDALIERTTSGSYGTPLAFYVTRDKAYRHQAEILYHARWAGYRMGARTVKTRTLKVKSHLQLLTQNLGLVNPSRLTPEWLEEQRQMLREQRVEFVAGFTSAWAAIAAHCQAAGDGPDDFSLRAASMTAEPLREDTRQMMESTFGCPVYSRYTTEELGVVAQECPGAKQHHLNLASFVFEVLDRESDTPVRPGEPGRLVITSLFSQAMPLIRYDVGDIVVREEGCACGWPGPVFTRVEGRAVETIYDAAGNRLSPFAINSRFMDLDNVVQLQFVQHAPARYTVRLHTLPAFDQEEEMRGLLLDVLGSEAQVTFEYVEEIPTLPSGKRPYIINEMDIPERAPAS